MRWEDQELNYGVPENKFPEVFFAGLWMLGCAAERQTRFLRLDQAKLDGMVQSGALTERAKGIRIDRLCLYYRLACSLGPGGDHYPVLGNTHFWRDSKSLYAILYISPKNDWLRHHGPQGRSAEPWRCIEWRPRDAARRSGRHGGTDIGELRMSS